MVNRRSKQEETTSNGLAKDMPLNKKISKNLKLTTEEFQGLAIFFGGVLLFLYTTEYFEEMLKWAVRFGAIALIIYGAYLSNLVDKTKGSYEYLRDKFYKK